MIEQTVKCDRCRRKIEGAYHRVAVDEIRVSKPRVDALGVPVGSIDLCGGCYAKLRKFFKWKEPADDGIPF